MPQWRKERYDYLHCERVPLLTRSFTAFFFHLTFLQFYKLIRKKGSKHKQEKSKVPVIQHPEINNVTTYLSALTYLPGIFPSAYTIAHIFSDKNGITLNMLFYNLYFHLIDITNICLCEENISPASFLTATWNLPIPCLAYAEGHLNCFQFFTHKECCGVNYFS